MTMYSIRLLIGKERHRNVPKRNSKNKAVLLVRPLFFVLFKLVSPPSLLLRIMSIIVYSRNSTQCYLWMSLRVDHLTFEGGMGDFEKKYILQTDFLGKKSCKEIPGGKKSHTELEQENKNPTKRRFMPMH